MVEKNEEKEWTLMFYIASDNELAPLVVSQLKAIKDAGFHEDINVLVHFDPNELGVPTRIYDVNRDRKRKLKLKRKSTPDLSNSIIGDGEDPFIRNLVEDNIDPEEITTKGRTASAGLKNALKALIEGDEVSAKDALKTFLSFCREFHPAKHYMLFLIGHGMVVGNDAFLPDERPISAITLISLEDILREFTDNIGKESTLELLALHSCSMSAIEVAYQLKGTAKYLMASEGPSFVGSYPYRQLLKKVFNNLKEAKKGGRDLDIQDLVERLYFLTLHNATDFLHAGYSFDLALCNLDPKKVEGVSESIRNLVGILKDGLTASSAGNNSVATKRGKRLKELVLLAHWEAQSYWGESYTDLFDFCRCLRERCDPKGALKYLHTACSDVIKKLDTNRSDVISERFEPLVIRSDQFGPQFQYSHGLSVYFPWSRPIETVAKRSNKARTGDREKYMDEEKGIMERYQVYAFTKELGENSWFSFLETYFKETRRRTREEEDPRPSKSRQAAREKAARAAGHFFTPLGTLAKVGPQLDKVGSQQGADCSCPSIKNFAHIPEEKKPGKGKATVRGRAAGKGKARIFSQDIPASEGSLRAFRDADDE
jgi:hypothetical protein